MIKIFYSVIILFLCLFNISVAQLYNQNQKKIQVDVCIYGGTASGVMAAVAASRMGKSVIIIEPKKHVGGLTSGGLGATDTGKKHAIYGLARNFYRRVGEFYGEFESWNFEPKIAEKVFNIYLEEEGVDVLFGYRVKHVNKVDNQISEVAFESVSNSTEQMIGAKIFIDCTYEGDLMAKSGVSYSYGRESNDEYGETKNGVQISHRHQFPGIIDPYIEEGKPSSGLIFGVSPTPIGELGSGDKHIQAYCFRLCLTTDKKNQIAITQPEYYDPAKYELLLRILDKIPQPSLDDVFIIKKMPNQKTDMNSLAGQSLDYHGANWEYPEGDYNERQKIWEEHVSYTKGMIYFLGHDKRVPMSVREDMLSYGYPKDEYIDNGGFTHELYVREARRMIGNYVMTEMNCVGNANVDDGIAFGSYNMDSHHNQTIVWNGHVVNEGEVTVHIPKEYPISYRSIVPREEECSNLLVPVCLSASHIAYGSVRMEPVFMELGQSAGMAAAMAIDMTVPVQKIDVKGLQKILKENPYLNKQKPDILLRIYDSTHYQIQGNWIIQKEIGFDYIEPYLFSVGGLEKNRIKFLLPINESESYNLFVHNPSHDDKKDGQLKFEISSKEGKIKKEVNLMKSSEFNGHMWSLGQYEFNFNSDNSVEVIGDNINVPIQVGYLLIVPVNR